MLRGKYFRTNKAQVEQITSKIESSEPSKSELYEALIKTKDDRIILLNNIINWILALAAILVTVAVVIFGWFLKNLKNKYKELVSQSNKAKVLVNKLEDTSKEISIIQEDIKTILSSKEYKEKILKK